MSIRDEHLRLSDVKQINGIVVTGVPSEIVVKVGTLPSLGDRSIVEWVRLVRPDTLNETRGILLVVMEDGV